MYIGGIYVRTQTGLKTRAAAARACTRQEFSPSDRQIIESISEQISMEYILKEYTYVIRTKIARLHVK